MKVYKQIKTHAYINIATYYRLKLASLLPDVSKIIYLDCDIIVNSDISELFDVNMDECLVAGVRDINRRMLKINPKYVNAGVLLLNLDMWRKENFEQKLLDYTKNNIDNINDIIIIEEKI